MDYEKLFKRLLMLNQKGAYLHGADGHVWISVDSEYEHPFHLSTVLLNSKIYGGVLEALDTIDRALALDGQDQLMEAWEKWGDSVQFLGNGGVSDSRIDVVTRGKGGLN